MLPNHNMPTFEVFLSFSFLFFSFLFFFIFTKNYTSIALYENNFPLYTYIPIHNELFLCTHALKPFLFMSTRSIYKPYLCSKISFFHFFQHTPVVYTKNSLHTLVVHIHKNFFSHIIYTHKILLFSFTYIKNYFLFFIYIDTTFVHNASFFLSGFLVHFIFRTTFLNEKLYTVPEFKQTLLTTTK